MTRIVAELAELGHEVHVVTALPWYRTHSVEAGWETRWYRREATEWGSITRVNPFAGSDKRNLARRAAGFVGFSALAGFASLRGGRVDAVIAMSPPLTMGLTGWGTHLVRRGPLVFNIQDVFPDAAVETGAITNKRIIGAAKWLERVSYHRAAAVTVLSDDLRENVVAKVRTSKQDDVRVIPNFVDTDAIRPARPDDRAARPSSASVTKRLCCTPATSGYSQSLEMVVAAARTLPELTFLINGDGAARSSLEESAKDLPNVRFSGYQPAEPPGRGTGNRRHPPRSA